MLQIIKVFVKNIKASGFKKTSEKTFHRVCSTLLYKFNNIFYKNSYNPLLANISNYEIKNIYISSFRNKFDKTIAIHLHLFYIDMLDYFIDRLSNIGHGFTLFVSISDTDTNIEELKNSFISKLNYLIDINIVLVENRGRDIAPLIITFGKKLLEYDFICHIHSKKSLHIVDGDRWRDNILNLLMGSISIVEQNLDLLEQGASITFPISNENIILRNGGWGDNYLIAKRVLKKYFKKNINNYNNIIFPQGSMFWARREAIVELLSMPLHYDDFPKEPLLYDGTIAHALERMILISTDVRGGRIITIKHSNLII